MKDAVIVAIITASASIICQLIISRASRHKDSIADARKDQEITDRLDAIESKLDIHNGYAEKFGDISIALTAIGKDIEYLKKRG